MFPNLARKYVRPLTSGQTCVNGSCDVSRVTTGLVAIAGSTAISSAARGDALTLTSAGSNIHTSQCSSDATLSPQLRCASADNDAASTITVLFVPESGGFRERCHRPTALDPATSHAPRSHVVSAIWEITREHQRVGIRGGSDGPSGASDAFSGTTRVSAVAMRCRESFSDARPSGKSVLDNWHKLVMFISR
jgi:hypothetical protein